MKQIITYGSFDLFHYGHILLLQRARNLGDHLTVGLSTKKFNLIKNKKCTHSYKQRYNFLKQLKIVDRIIPENSWDQKIQDVIKYNIDTFIIGDDWKNHFNFLNLYCEVVYLPRTKKISSSSLRNYLINK